MLSSRDVFVYNNSPSNIGLSFEGSIRTGYKIYSKDNQLVSSQSVNSTVYGVPNNFTQAQIKYYLSLSKKKIQIFEIDADKFPIKIESSLFYSIDSEDCSETKTKILTLEEAVDGILMDFSCQHVSFIGDHYFFYTSIYPFTILNRELPKCDFFFFDQPNYYVEEYQYSVDGINFFPLPINYENKVYFDDLVGLDVLPKKLFIRGVNRDTKKDIRSCNVGLPFYTNIATYTVINCSPKLVSSIATNTKCFNSSDGFIKFKFDRDLDEDLVKNEKFIFTLKNSVNNGVVGQREVLASEFNNHNQEYLWSGLSGGSYVLEYQTIKGTNSPSDLVRSPSILITSPSPVTFSTSQTNVLCHGASTGTITVTAAGGTGNYQYSKDGGATWQTSNVFSGLPESSYSVVVKDANECNAPGGVQKVTITQPNAPLKITDVKKNPTAYNRIDGSISLEVTGGTAPYTYQWVSTTNNISGQEQNQNLVNLGGTAQYTVTVTDKVGCKMVKTIDLKTPDPIVITFNQPKIRCHNGTVDLTATVTGGNTPYQALNWSVNAYPVVTTGNTSTLQGIPAGTYSLTVIDALNVTESTPAVIDPAPAPLEILVEPTVTIKGGIATVYQKCYNDTQTKLDVSVQGGAAPYTYAWIDLKNPSTVVSTNEDLISVTPGNYKLTLTDANTCTTFRQFSVIGATPITVVVTPKHIKDPGTNTGEIIVKATGGSGAYKYSLDGVKWQDDAVFVDLMAGSYAIHVKDSNECLAILKATAIIEPPTFDVKIALVKGISCHGDSTASLKAIATGGTPQINPPYYDYIWTNTTTGMLYTGENISNIPVGIYNLVVTDKNGVTRTATYELKAPDPLSLSPSFTPVKCFNANDGEIVLDAKGGTMPYTYYLNDVVYPDKKITGLKTGVYLPKVTDAQGCSIEGTPIEIKQPSVLSATHTIYPVSFVGANDGAIEVTVSGGTLPYSYKWTPDLGNTNYPKNLSKNDYTLTITDANGCHLDKRYAVGLIEPLRVNLDAPNSIVELNCFGDKIAKIGILISGGRPATKEPSYNIAWYNDQNQFLGNTPTISNLPAGNYTVTVTDFNTPKGQITQTFTVKQPLAPLNLQLTLSKKVLCNKQTTAELQTMVQGGTSPYNYQWKNATNQLVGTTANLSNIGAGVYTCSVIDAKGCKINQSFTVTEPTILTATLTATDVRINGQKTGSIVVNQILGGTSPYRFALDNGNWQTSTLFSGLGKGSYKVTVEDANGCTLVLNTNILEPEVLKTTILNVNQTNIKCNGDKTINLESVTTGGIKPYFFQWKQNGQLMVNAQLDKLNLVGAGVYEVMIKDNAGATTSAILTVNEPQKLSATYTTVDASCDAPLGGKIAVQVSGGTPPYTYEWNKGVKGTNSVLENISIGNYNVIITDANNCVLDDPQLKNINIKTTGGLQLNEKIKAVSCGELNNGKIDLSPSGGTGNYSIVWDDKTLQGFHLQDLMAKTYTGTLTDTGSNCSLPIALTVGGSTPLVVNLGSDMVLCKGQTHTIDAEIKLPGLIYLWTSDKGFRSTNPKVTLKESGVYTLKVTNGDCQYTDQIAIQVLNETIEANFMIATQTYKDEEIVLVNISNNPTSNTYEWILPVGAEIVAQNQDNMIIKFKENGKYQVGIKCKNALGCETQQLNEIIVEENTKGTTADTSALFVKNYKIYPNPLESNDDQINVEVELAFELPVTLSIYRMELGALILELEKPANKKHIEKIPFHHAAGVYYIIMKTKGAVQAKKIIRK
ncbi:T9SS type A sorting domain-containing protein [Flavobacterium davisii]|uniref:T9SS type A sorting domain-containing protein n=1 Tax=Flavobacterium davisii TaxID=2906077 RepID=UPI0013FD5DAA|nr:T9SS type A sorting domain-containing protein [Flavobacterium davisii]